MDRALQDFDVFRMFFNAFAQDLWHQVAQMSPAFWSLAQA